MKIIVFILFIFCFSCIFAKNQEKIKLKNIEFFELKEKKQDKFGQELFDDLKKVEKNLKQYINFILVPPFLRKNIKVHVELEEDFEIGYIYEYKF